MNAADTEERRREALASFMESRGLRPHTWATRAGVSSGSLYAFLKGETASLSTPVLDKLAADVGVSVAVLLGEADPPPTELMPAHIIDQNASLLPRKRQPARMIPSPQRADQQAVAAAGFGSDVLLPIRKGGAIVYSAERRDPQTCVGMLCVVAVLGHDELLLREVHRGYAARRYNLVDPRGGITADAEVLYAHPVEWIRPG